MNLHKVIHISLLFLILIIGFTLRVTNLGVHDLWYDEVITYKCSQYPSTLNITAHHSPYYLILHLWTNLFGESEFSLRFSSLIFGFFSIILIYLLVNLIFDKKTSLLSAFLLSISPFHIWYSQEVGFYSLRVFLLLCSACLLILALRRQKLYIWLCFIFSIALTLHIDYHSIFIFLATGSMLFFSKYRDSFIKWVYATSIGIGIFYFLRFYNSALNSFSMSPILSITWIKDYFWIPKPSLKSLWITFENFNLGYTASKYTYLFSMIIIIPVFLKSIIQVRNRYIKGKVLYVLFLLNFPLITVFIISQWVPIYLDRAFIGLSTFYYIIVAVCFTHIKNRLFKFTVMGFFVVTVCLSLYNYYTGYMPSPLNHHVGVHMKKPFKNVVKSVGKDFSKEDKIVHTNIGTCMPFIYYWNREYIEKAEHCYYIIPEAQEKFWNKRFEFWEIEGTSAFFNINFVDLTEGIRQKNCDRIWLISSDWTRDGTLDSNSLAVRAWLGKHYNRVFEKWMDEILIGFYESKN